MNPESLKLIVEALNSLGGNVKEAFIWYLVATQGKDLFLAIIGYAMVAVFIVILAKKVLHPIISAIQASNDATEYFKKIRDRYRIGSGGFLGSSEAHEVAAKLDEALAALAATKK
jgi:hypothetical protein